MTLVKSSRHIQLPTTVNVVEIGKLLALGKKM